MTAAASWSASRATSRVRRFVLLPRDFSVDGGELSPALKLRRRVIYEKYRDRIERMYAEAA